MDFACRQNTGMYIRTKRVRSADKVWEYLQIVESVREAGKIKQRVIGTLGRADQLVGTGKMDALVNGMGKYCRQVQVVDAFREGAIEAEWSKAWGPVVVFRRLWEELGLPRILKQLSADRRMEFDVDACVFALALQRIFCPGSDRSGSNWIATMLYPPFWQLQLQHLYRTLDFLAENKDLIEAELFYVRRDIGLLDVDLVFFDTTTLYFEGEGPDGLAARGHSKDYRPQNTQVVICVVMGRDGFPLSCEVWPGSTADVNSVQKVVATLKNRFGIRRTILVCDRGMISAQNLRRIRKAGMDYIIGARMRKYNEVKREVLGRAGRYAFVSDNLQVKEVRVGKTRYVLCVNPQEAERDRLTRDTMVERLEAKLKSGEVKDLIGNRGYRHYLKVEKGGVSIEYARLKEEARFDGKWAVRTSTALPAAEVATVYKSLHVIESLNRSFKDVLETRPIYHRLEERVKGHVFGSFLALLMMTSLKHKLDAQQEANLPPDWDRMMQDLAAVQGVKLKLNGTSYILRTELPGIAHRAFAAAGVRPPPRVQPLSDSTQFVVPKSFDAPADPHQALLF